MGGEITGAPSPLVLRIGEGLAINASLQSEGLTATLAGLDDRMAGATIVAATVFAHEGALFTLFDRLTEHGLSLLYHAVHTGAGVCPVVLEQKPGRV